MWKERQEQLIRVTPSKIKSDDAYDVNRIVATQLHHAFDLTTCHVKIKRFQKNPFDLGPSEKIRLLQDHKL